LPVRADGAKTHSGVEKSALLIEFAMTAMTKVSAKTPKSSAISMLTSSKFKTKWKPLTRPWLNTADRYRGMALRRGVNPWYVGVDFMT